MKELQMGVNDFIVRLIFPPKCIFCSELIDRRSEIEICEKCFSKIPFVTDQKVFIKKFMRGVEPDSMWLDSITCICEYKGIIKEAIIKYKYFGKYSYHRAFAFLMAKKLEVIKNSSEHDIIISVPLHKKREKVRGYNQSFLISSKLSKITGIPERSLVLERMRYTNTQSLLHRDERYLNVKDAFKVNNEKEVENKVVLLIDDVVTMGYTLNECSKALKKAGATKVHALVIAAAVSNIEESS